MPVIINELIIKAEVSDSPVGGSAGSNAGASSSKKGAEYRETLIQECVAQVLEILEKKKMP